MNRHSLILDRWRAALADGDSHFTPSGIEAVDVVLRDFERQAASAAGRPDLLSQVLRATVLQLDRIGGEHGQHGSFIDTDEREELVPFLLGVVGEHGLDVGGADPTEPYRPW
jgi:hypothetical protein